MNKPLTTVCERLMEISELEKKASKGPWECYFNIYPIEIYPEGDPDQIPDEDWFELSLRGWDRPEENARLVVASRNIAPIHAALAAVIKAADAVSDAFSEEGEYEKPLSITILDKALADLAEIAGREK